MQNPKLFKIRKLFGITPQKIFLAEGRRVEIIDQYGRDRQGEEERLGNLGTQNLLKILSSENC